MREADEAFNVSATNHLAKDLLEPFFVSKGGFRLSRAQLQEVCSAQGDGGYAMLKAATSPVLGQLRTLTGHYEATAHKVQREVRARQPYP